MNPQLSISFTGEMLRDRGIEQAVSHAESKTENWKDITWNLFREFLESVREPFQIEDFRSWLAVYKPAYDFPPSLRAFGFVSQKAARQGLIKQIGTRKVKNTRARCANAALWIKL